MESKYAGMSPYNYGNCNPITFNDPSGMSGEDTVKVSEQGQSRLIETAKNTSQFKDAVKRGDKIVLEQYFHISGSVAQSQQELNKGEEGANVFYISQSGWAGLPHNFDYIRGLTNVGNEHYFNKLIFKKLKFK